MGLFDFLRRNLPVKRHQLKMEIRLLLNLKIQMIALQDGKRLMQNLDRLYPDQPNPLHYGTVVKYMFGGPDPLDGISVYDAGDFGILSAMACRSYIQKKAPTQNTVVMGLN